MQITDLPIEMQQQITMQKAIDENRNAAVKELDDKRAKHDAVRMAKDVVMENHRSAPPGTVITSENITSIAEDLIQTMNN